MRVLCIHEQDCRDEGVSLHVRATRAQLNTSDKETFHGEP